MSVRTMLSQMDSRDYREIQEYFGICGGLGPEEDWRWRATVLSFLYNPNRGKDAQALLPEDFYPWLKGPKPALTPEQEEEKAAKQATRMKYAMIAQAWKERGLLPEEREALFANRKRPESPPPAPKE